MSKYDKAAEQRISKLIQQSARNESLAGDTKVLSRPKAHAISTHERHGKMMEELQGE